MKEMEEKIAELREKKLNFSDSSRQKEVETQHKVGKLTARERIDKLIDPGTFTETEMFVKHRCTSFGMDKKEVPAEGVVTGYGKINGREVMVFSEDYTALAGTFGEYHGSKITKSIQMAMNMRVPVIGLNDSGGARLQEGIDASHAYSKLFSAQIKASGVVPQIALLMGPCLGGQAYHPIMMDFLFMVRGTSHMAIAGPAFVKTITGEEIGLEELGGADVHARLSGGADLVAENDDQCLKRTKELLSFLPSNNNEKSPYLSTNDAPDRMDESLQTIAPTNSAIPFNMYEVIKRVVDDGYFFEIKSDYAKNIITCFARFGGHTVGIIANQSMVLAGGIDINAADKATRFIRFCDIFNIPLIQFQDSPAYWIGTKQEWGGILRHGAKMLFAFIEATVPKITIIVRKAYAGAYIGMCNKDSGADLVYSWANGEIALVGPETAASVIFAKEIRNAENPGEVRKQRIKEYADRFVTPYLAAERGYIDGVIEPRETRLYLIRALELTKNKIDVRPHKKYANITM